MYTLHINLILICIVIEVVHLNVLRYWRCFNSNRIPQTTSSSTFWSATFYSPDLKAICINYAGIMMKSDILTDAEQFDLFHLFNSRYGDTDYFSLQLLYSATNDAFDFNEFRINCIGYQNILILMENNYGNVIGGFLSKGFPFKTGTVFIWLLTICIEGYPTDLDSFLLRIRSNDANLPPKILPPKTQYQDHVVHDYCFAHILGFGIDDMVIFKSRIYWEYTIWPLPGCGIGECEVKPRIYDFDAKEFCGSDDGTTSFAKCTIKKIEIFTVTNL